MNTQDRNQSEVNKNATKASQEKKLEIQLRDLGSSKVKFNIALRAYESLRGDKAINNYMAAWQKIGDFCQACKQGAEGSNPNSGLFKSFVTERFPRLSSNEISLAIRYSKHYEAYNKFQEETGCKVSSPDALSRAVRKKLKADEAGKEEYEKFGLRLPVKKESKKEVNNEPGLSDGENIITGRHIKNMSVGELLMWTQNFVSELQKRGKKQGGQEALHKDRNKLEELSIALANIQSDAATALIKAGKLNEKKTEGEERATAKNVVAMK